MKISKVNLVYFSPTQTTGKILQAFVLTFHEENPRTNFTCAGIFIP